MNHIVANEDGVTVSREKVEPCTIRWDELKSIECYRMMGVTCLEFRYVGGGFLSADSAMPGFGQVMKMLDIYVPLTLAAWRERVAGLTEGQGAPIIQLYFREESREAAMSPAAGAGMAEASVRFPRTAKYDPQWVIDNVMGPNPLMLAEWLMESMELKAGMRVLDLGCGRAASSIFLAKEYGVTVWAADLWVKPTDNAVRIQEAEVGDQVMPVNAEAHALPFAQEYFDAIVSIDAYHYFGTDDLYLGYLARYLRSGGRLGIVGPAVNAEIGEAIPAALQGYWEGEFCSFHTPAWWRQHWKKTGLVEVEAADALEGGAALWREWAEACAEKGPASWKDAMAKEAEMLRADQGETLGLARVVAKKK